MFIHDDLLAVLLILFVISISGNVAQFLYSLGNSEFETHLRGEISKATGRAKLFKARWEQSESRISEIERHTDDLEEQLEVARGALKPLLARKPGAKNAMRRKLISDVVYYDSPEELEVRHRDS